MLGSEVALNEAAWQCRASVIPAPRAALMQAAGSRSLERNSTIHQKYIEEEMP